MRKITVVASLCAAAAAVAVVAGVATASPTAAAPAATRTVAVAAVSSASTLGEQAGQIAQAAVAKVYDAKATVISSTATEGVWYEVFLIDTTKTHEFAVLVDIKTGTAGAMKKVPAGSLPVK